MATLVLVILLGTPVPAPAADYLTGKLLVAGPDLVDPNFGQAVVLVLRHDAGGAFGLIVNRPVGRVPLGRLLQEAERSGGGAKPDLPQQEQGDPAGDNTKLPVFYGGPVEPYLGFTLHSQDVMPENSEAISDGTALNVEDDALRALAAGDGPQRVIFLLGYAGWAPGQLENEMKRGSWLVIEADPDLIFSEEPARTWERAVARVSTDL